MIKRLLIIILLVFLTSCKSKQNLSQTKQQTNYHIKKTKNDKIVAYAKKFLGTKYKYGGTTKKGMDCSGLVFTSFKQENILLPRASKNMALKGKTIPLKQIQKGDLLFFITGKKNSISHVGIVTEIKNKEIFFIHASTKRGVIISSMHEKYYKTRFAKAKRVL